MSIDLESIMDINEVGGFFQVQFYLTMSWFESRLKFQNLKSDISLNGFLPSETTQVWVPELVFENTEEKSSTIIDEKATIKVTKGGEFKANKKDENENIQYYAGSENQLAMTRFYNQRFLCDYEMAWYPFDVQQCQLTMSMRRAFDPFTQLIAQKMRYLGPTSMTKYDVISTKMEVIQLGEVEAIQVTVTLGRKLLGVLLNVFVPTTILNLIGFSTNFYKDAYFESVIAINLTSMLVLVALFVQVNSDLPVTAYIKMVDVWLIFNLIIPFVLIVIHTYMDTLRPGDEKEEEQESQPSSQSLRGEGGVPGDDGLAKFSIEDPNAKLTKMSLTERRKRRAMRICFNVANIVLPAICIVFVVVFFTTGAVTSSTSGL